MAKGKVTCPVCGARIKGANYESHVKRVHPHYREDGDEESFSYGAGSSSSSTRTMITLFAIIAVLILVIASMTYLFVIRPGQDATDKDEDGMPDNWELLVGLDITIDDSDLDPDQDELANKNEYTHNTDPQNSDSDGDGMPDGYEVQQGFVPVNPTDRYADPDGDGINNLEEYLRGMDPKVSDRKDEPSTSTGGNRVVEITTSKGVIRFVLYEDKVPTTTNNFVKYVEAGFYDGLVFHRVIDDFMIQGGGFYRQNDQLIEKPTLYDPIPLEVRDDLKHIDGAVAMARTSSPDSATSQFFIDDGAQPQLEPGGVDANGYAVFGQVTEGMDIVRAIASTPTGTDSGMSDVPQTDIVIQSVRLV